MVAVKLSLAVDLAIIVWALLPRYRVKLVGILLLLFFVGIG